MDVKGLRQKGLRILKEAGRESLRVRLREAGVGKGSRVWGETKGSRWVWVRGQKTTSDASIFGVIILDVVLWPSIYSF